MSLYITFTNKPCPHCGLSKPGFSANITHNLNKMADVVLITTVASLYQYVWCPEELGVTTAKQLIDPLTIGIADMKADPDKFKVFDSSNGWGIYDDFVPWLERYLEACKENPDATIKVSTS